MKLQIYQKLLPTGYKYIVVLTIELDVNISIYDSNQVADPLELEIISLISKVKKVMIHVHPVKR